MAASRVLGGSGGLGLLLSGLPALIIGFAVLYSIAWIIAPKFNDIVEYTLEIVGRSFRQAYRLTKKTPKATEAEELLIPLEGQPRSPGMQEQRAAGRDAAQSTPKTIAVCFTTLTVSIVVLILQLVRPTHPPYAHMSGSLPVTLIEAALFQPINSEFCLAHPVERVLFPWDTFTEYFGQPASLDWMPKSPTCSRANGPGPPSWMTQPDCEAPNSCAPWPEDSHPPPHPPHHGGHGPPPPPHGHGPPPHGHGPPPPGPHHRPPPPPRDAQHDYHDGPPVNRGHGFGAGYDSLCDPLKISNLDADVVGALANGMKTKKPKIKNVLLLTLESTRKDMFPLKKDSHAYKTVLSSYTSENASQELDAKLSDLTRVATFLSGEDNGFNIDGEAIPESSWRHAFKDGMGSINIQGAVTQAAYTLKSLLSSHCGVEPLPVDFTEETKGSIYQYCLPHVLDLMNENSKKRQQRDNQQPVEDHRAWSWESTLVQSVTDMFDSQDVLDGQMGFKNVISERVLSDPTSKHYPPKEPWVNYFGYPEAESLDYLRDLFVDARQHQKRLFVSHLTSSPHHPFATPKDWAGHQDYLSKQRWRPEDPLDGYLNTIKYQDDWISDIFQMLHDTGALNETLIIMTGDHGLAFNSLDKSQSAVNNGHISNFAIPLLFVHPDLPRVQLQASTTPLSIIPTVLDLLLQTESLPESSLDVAKTLLPKYQGNSLIRDLNYTVLTADGGVGKAFFQPFHFSAINPGGSLLAISDASSTFRLVFPLCSSIPLRFTDISTDPTESDPVIAWTMDELAAIIKVKHGVKAKEWAKLAQELGRWWFWDQHDKWGYWGNARSTSRGGQEIAGAGRVKKKHWWETR